MTVSHNPSRDEDKLDVLEDKDDEPTTEEKKKMLEEIYVKNYRVYDRLAEL